MPVSPADFALWASATGNPYPRTPGERAALAPEVFGFIKNYAKRPESGGLGNVIHEQPQTQRHFDDNSVFGASVTPDNQIPKVAGAVDASLTGQHYTNREEENTTERNQLIGTLGKAALAAGVVAGGVAAARSALGQQVISDVGSRVSDFLSGLGKAREVDIDAVSASGDITPKTTAQNYQQPLVANQTQAVKNSYLAGLLKGAETTQTGKLATRQASSPQGTSFADLEIPTLSPKAAYIRHLGYTEDLTQKYPNLTAPEIKEQLAVERLNAMSRKYGDPFSTSERLPSDIYPTPTPQGEYVTTPEVTTQLQRLAEEKKTLGPAFFPTQQAAPTESPAALTEAAPVRQRPIRQLSDEQVKAYNLIAAGAEQGIKIEPTRAMDIVTGRAADLSYGEMQAYEPAERVASRGQSFAPGQQQSGRMMEMRTGSSARERAVDLIQQLEEQNIAGLSSQQRKSAGAQRLRGFAEQDEPQNVLVTGTGRRMRAMGHLDPEALGEGRIVYQPFTEVVTGSTPATQQQAREALQAAQAPSKIKQLNQLFATHSQAESGELLKTGPGLMNIKTESGIMPITTKEFRNRYGQIANDVFNRAVQYYATQQNIQLPKTEEGLIDTTHPEYFATGNQLLYGAGEESKERTKLLGKAFNQGLKAAGLDLATEDPYASHTLFAITRDQTRGNLALSTFGTLSGRLEARGLAKPGGQAPIGLPGPAAEVATQAVAQSLDPFTPAVHTERGMIGPATQPRTGVRLMEQVARQEGPVRRQPIQYQPEISEEQVSVWRSGQPLGIERPAAETTTEQFVATEAPRSSMSRDVRTGRPLEFLGLFKTRKF